MWLSVVLVVGLAVPALTKTSGDRQAETLFLHYNYWRMQDNPEFATSIGNHSFDHQLQSVTLGARQNRVREAKSFLDKLERLLKEDMSYQTSISANILRHNLQSFVDNEKFKGYVFSTNYLDSVAQGFRYVIIDMKLETEDDYRNLLQRFAAFPTLVQELTDLLRQGIEEGMTYHRVSVETMPEQLRATNVSIEESVYYKPFTEIPEEIGEPIRSELQMKGRLGVKEQVITPLLQLADFIETEYLPKTRESIGATSLPGGKEYYQACLKYHTSGDRSAEEIHQIGMDEVKRIETQMKKIAVGQGYGNISPTEFSEKLRQDPSNFHTDPDALIDGFTKIIRERIQPQLETVVWKLPSDDVVVEKKPAHQKKAVSASYRAPAFDGSRPGKFMVNANLFDKIPKYEMMALSLHEANPGHHLYFSVLKDNTGLPVFRRAFGDSFGTGAAPSGLPHGTAIIEGWALYAEALGETMSLYEGRPLERYGGYSKEIFRACRLVVDTGMHALNWTQQMAVDYMLEHTAASKAQIENEIRRYITWPGQATAYKMGELKLKELRRRAIKRLNSKFDLRTFHQVILDCAGPLPIVESCVNRYIEEDGRWESVSGAAPHTSSCLLLALGVLILNLRHLVG